MINRIQADWDAPDNIKTLITTRAGGNSQFPYESFNLALHVGDDPLAVARNRYKLRQQLPADPVWLNQIHSNRVIEAQAAAVDSNADGSYSCRKNTVAIVMTADCLPALICNRQGNAVAAIHAGWRGLLEGILEQGVEQLLKVSQCQNDDVMVWLGPAIGPENFEVGEDVRQLFLERAKTYPAEMLNKLKQCFTAINNPQQKNNKYLADIYQLARIRLSLIGVDNVSGGHYCTYSEQDKFYSYRRDGKTGRMASMIWLE